jgi:hypothetical protein
MQKLIAVILIGLLTTIYVTGSFWLKIGDERAQAIRLQKHINELEAAPPPSAISPVSVPVRAPRPAAEPAKTANTVTSASTTLANKSVTAAIKQVLANTNGSGNSMMHMVLLRQYPDLTKELAISQEQADQLIDVIARQQAEIAADELGVLSGEVTDPAAVRAVQSKVENRRRTADAEIATLLDSKYGDWQRYQATAAARLQVARLQSVLESSNPLSESQSKALLTIFADTQSQLITEHRNEPELRGNSRQEILVEQIKRQDMASERMFDAASPILTSPQLEIYKRSLDQLGALMRATMRAMSGDSEPQATTP